MVFFDYIDILCISIVKIYLYKWTFLCMFKMLSLPGVKNKRLFFILENSEFTLTLKKYF